MDFKAVDIHIKRNAKPELRSGRVISVLGGSARVQFNGDRKLELVTCDINNPPRSGDIVNCTRPKGTRLWTVASTRSSPSSAQRKYPGQAAILAVGVSAGGSAYAFTMDSASRFNHYLLWGGADGDEAYVDFYLESGTYTLLVNGSVTGGSGMFDYYIDDTLVTTFDWYNVSIVANTSKTVTVVIPYDGLHTLKIVCNGKNASSSGYTNRLVYISFLP